jgi:hypothetical protein
MITRRAAFRLEIHPFNFFELLQIQTLESTQLILVLGQVKYGILWETQQRLCRVQKTADKGMCRRPFIFLTSSAPTFVFTISLSRF